MANLETAGGQALDKLKELLPEFELADKAFGQAEEDMKKAQADLATDWAEVEQAANAFLEQVKQERTDFSSEVQETLQNITECKNKVIEITGKAKEAADGAEQELSDFIEEVKKLEPEIEKVMKKVDDAAKSLKDRADNIEEALEKAASDVADFLEQEIVSSFKEFQQEVEQRAEDLQGYITDTVVPKMEEKASDLAENLSKFASDLQSKMEETGSNALDQATEALNKCFGDHKEIIDSIMELGESLNKVLEALSDAVDSAGKVVGQTKEAVDIGVDTTSVGLNAIVGTIDELMQFFSRFSFA